MSRNPQYVIDLKGKKRSVLLPIAEYKRLSREIEDLRDALELEERAKTAKDFLPYDRVREKLKAQGRL